MNSAEPSFTFNINLATTKLQSPVHAKFYHCIFGCAMLFRCADRNA